MRKFSDECCRENQNTHVMLRNVSPENCAADDITVRHMRFTCWIRLQTHTQNMEYLLFFHGNSGFANAPHCNVLLPVLFHFAYVMPDFADPSGRAV